MTIRDSYIVTLAKAKARLGIALEVMRCNVPSGHEG